MASLSSFFVDDTAYGARQIEVPDAVWNSGLLLGGSNSPGIGISTENPNLEEQLPNWTLLDQHGNARNAQIGQSVGGEGWVDRSVVDWPSSGGAAGTLPNDTIRLYDNTTQDGSGSASFPADGASLVDLAVGWAPQV